MGTGVGRVAGERSTSKEEVGKALKKLKMGKAPGVDGICGEMLKYGGEVVLEWVTQMCGIAWESSRVPYNNTAKGFSFGGFCFLMLYFMYICNYFYWQTTIYVLNPYILQSCGIGLGR